MRTGNAGGPRVDAPGNLIGVVSAKLNALKVMVATNGDIPQNVSFAIKGSLAGRSRKATVWPTRPGPTPGPWRQPIRPSTPKVLRAFVACR